MDYYILVDREPVKTDLHGWSECLRDINNRIVARTDIGDVTVSTVFLGLDHRFEDDPTVKPILFETMVFGGPHDEEMERYCTWNQAEEGHNKMVDKYSKLKG